jgi:asparagine synthase (glutamine-hydrolysing)
MKLSGIIKNGELVSEKDWIKHIDSLREKGTATKEELKEAIIDAVRKRIPEKRFGIFFSGGIDSTLIAMLCKRLGARFICYSIGYGNADDIMWANKVSAKLKLNLKKRILEFYEAENYINKTAKLLGEIERPVVHVGVGAVFMAAADLAKEDNIDVFFSGLGSEEIFAGYERHEKSKDINEECWFGLKRMIQGDLKRDYLIGKEKKIEVLTPFLDENVIRTAMKIPGNEKIKGEHKKAVLREIAEEMGLQREFAWRKKKAAQYGSRIDKAIGKLAGKQQKGDYLKGLL